MAVKNWLDALHGLMRVAKGLTNFEECMVTRTISETTQAVNVNPTAKTRRWQMAIWSAIVALSLFLSLRHYDAFQVGTYADDAEYIVLARSLVSGHGFGLIHSPATEPLPSPFPFGYPALLAPLVVALPDNLEILKTPSLLATLANGALLFWGWHWFSRRSRWWGLAVSSLYLLFPYVIDHSRMVMSEAVFTTLCLLALLLTEQIARRKPIAWRAPLLGVVLACALFVRSIGLVFALTAPAYVLWRRRSEGWRPIGLAGAAGLCLTGLVLWLLPVGLDGLMPVRYLTERNNSLYLVVARETGSASGDDSGPAAAPGSITQSRGSAVLHVLLRARRHLTTDLRQTVLPVGAGKSEAQLAALLGAPWLSTALSALVLALVVAGGLAGRIEEGASAFAVGGLAYFGATLLWDWTGPRLLYPVLPQLTLCFLTGIAAVPRAASAAARRWLPGVRDTRRCAWMWRACTVGAVIVFGCVAVRASYRLPDSWLHAGDLSARTDWLRVNTPASAVVMSEQPVTDFLYGGRRTVWQPGTVTSTADLCRLLVAEGVDYVLVGPKLQWQTAYDPVYSERTEGLLPRLAELRSSGLLTEVYSNSKERLVVFEVQEP